ncbi:hypothetical protein G3N59_10495 [Paraburkholderia sp. Ac-20340]|uniref:hypothetical protein n=1 Tax=Paraburkholderia sp. Ac-20340 TaxID=2703888 RepID=UPI00197F8838|nr:hypothetical protein [Paraburkholderia sp. Ac-20340]MBN3853809.1 hypothetical protein [Paraburkholderia sp. Ac-20340]
MADEQTPATPTPEPETAKLLTKDQLSEYFNTVHKGSCPSCGERKWAVIGSPADTTAFVYYHSAKRITPKTIYPKSLIDPNTFPVVNLMCNTCGLIQPFSYYTIERWAENNKK